MDNALLTHDDNFRTSYLVLLTSVATANHQNSTEEVAFMKQMCQAAELSQGGAQHVIQAMQNPSSASFSEHAQVLQNDDLRFSLVADIINLAYADGDIDADELQQIKSVNRSLNISDQQFDALSSYIKKANGAAAQQEGIPGLGDIMASAGGGSADSGGFLASSGLAGMFSQANIPAKNFQSGSTIGTVLTGLAANFLQGKMSGGGAQSSGGGLDLGSIAGSLLGGMGNSQQGNAGGGQSGLGGMLSGILSSSQGKAAIGGLVSQVLSGNQKGNGLVNLASLLGGGGQQRQQNTGGGLGSIIGSLLGG